jgi:hypothetical protein
LFQWRESCTDHHHQGDGGGDCLHIVDLDNVDDGGHHHDNSGLYDHDGRAHPS